ncbi:MAG: tRNA 2-selenouridine(34) synthase MnmH [Pseudomonadota bacterium]
MPLEFPSDYPDTPLPFDALIDVRSPAEFAEDHIPGAINLPVLSNEERARVGTIYKQDSPFRARKIGAALVARNAAHHIETALAGHDGGWRPLVYCWRGGQRSGAFATILGQIGWRAETLAGGYRAYRRTIVERLYDRDWPYRMILLNGLTGTGKTEILQRLGHRGGQTIDLEGMANHRGSVFGAKERAQPSQKCLESRIVAALRGFDATVPILAEAEASRIGNLQVPPTLWNAMAAAPQIEISAPLEARVAFTLEHYADFAADRDRLGTALGALIRFHGKERVAQWQNLAQKGALPELVADLLRHHYDPRYRKSQIQHEPTVALRVDLPDLSLGSLDRAAAEIESCFAGVKPAQFAAGRA